VEEPLLKKLFVSKNNEDEIKSNLKVYAIIDAAKIEKLTNELTVLANSQYQILFDGKDAIELEEVAPYLIELKKEDEFTEWVAQEVYGNSGAIFIRSYESLETLAQHLKPFIPVTREVEYQGKTITQKGYLAYYDPRVFFEWINSIESEKQEKFFHHIENIYHEDIFTKSTLWISSYTQELQQVTRELSL